MAEKACKFWMRATTALGRHLLEHLSENIFRIEAIERVLSSALLGPHEVFLISVAVIYSSFVFLAETNVGLRQLFESFLGPLGLIFIGMNFQGFFTISLFDFVMGGGF
jgi:hypothetical protein